MATQNGGSAEGKSPSLNVLAQFIKDFSFENPNAPRSLVSQGQAPQISVQINVNGKPMSETDFEVELTISGKAEQQLAVLFSFDLNYGGVFRVQNVPTENVHPIVLIECPRLLFPFARQIIADAVRNGGFPPLLLEPVDFAALYRQRIAELQAPAPAAAPA